MNFIQAYNGHVSSRNLYQLIVMQHLQEWVHGAAWRCWFEMMSHVTQAGFQLATCLNWPGPPNPTSASQQLRLQGCHHAWSCMFFSLAFVQLNALVLRLDLIKLMDITKLTSWSLIPGIHTIEILSPYMCPHTYMCAHRCWSWKDGSVFRGCLQEDDLSLVLAPARQITTFCEFQGT